MSTIKAEQYVRDNAFMLVVILAIVVIGVAMYLKNKPKRKKRKGIKKLAEADQLIFVTLFIGLGALGLFIIGLIYLLMAGSLLVIGNWFVYDQRPSGTLQWFLVFWVIFIWSVQLLSAIAND